MEKKCFGCEKKKSVELFFKNKSKEDGLSSRCKDCTHAETRNWKSRNPILLKEQQKRYALKRRNLILDHYGRKCFC